MLTIAVPEKLLDGADVVAVLQEVCRKVVSPGMDLPRLSDQAGGSAVGASMGVVFLRKSQRG